jgi:hypothetical protein
MSNATVGGRMRGFIVRYILFLTLLWVVVLNVMDLLPKEGELIPRDGAWRPATEADRIQSFLWFTGCWYLGALVAFGLVWRVAQVMYDMAFGDERGE